MTIRLIITLLSLICHISLQAQQTGIFNHNTDIGAVRHPGSAVYDETAGEYLLSGAGTNIWFDHDELHYLWKNISGDFILQARGALIGKGVDPHRKFGWMVRSSLDTSAATVAATVHGDGLTALQYRKTARANMEEARSTATAPDVIQLERRGNRYTMSVARFGEPFTITEVSGLDLGHAVYVGLFICSHNKDVVEKVRFDNVRIIVPAKENFAPYRDYIGSHIETMDVETGRREIIYSSTESLQAPNWTLDGKSLIYNSKGLVYRLDLNSRIPVEFNTGKIRQNNNDHVISFDGKMLGLSSSSGDPKYGSLVYTVPIGGGTPVQITPTGPSYLHGWSPDGKWLTYTGGRNDNYDIYKIQAKGGREIRLTTAPALDDGSEYSPDGKYIYFNSARTGRMQLWRMKPNGKRQEQLTFDEFNNWFPHISPDGKWIVFLSYGPEIKADDHPFYKQVYLRLMPAGGGPAKMIAYLYGGQGSINTPSWSPDGKKIAFVSNSALSAASLAKGEVGVGAKPPAGADILFDGSRQMLDDKWTYWAGPRLAAAPPIKWTIVNDPVDKGTCVSSNDPAAAGGKYGSADIVTKKAYRDFRLHVEFLIANPGGNSGVYLQNRYEIQVLDGDSTSHGMAAVINEAAAPYRPYRGLGRWNAYDIVFKAARFVEGKLTEKARVTVYFNGVEVHHDQPIQQVWGGPNSGIDGGNDGGKGITDVPGGLKLQAEGHDVLYRNIWIKELDLGDGGTGF